MIVKIYKPAKTAMQSGRAKTRYWQLQFSDNSIQTKDPLIGYHGGSNTRNQIKLQFETKEDAINFAKSKNYDYEVLEPSARKIIKKSYADNFK
ncbi:MAG: ETC complex I subunit [Candidatus Pelagibacterales bacterium]|jgi:hypothetical protein|tara:strand:- start:36 stop:314 length:279 start_codon:yes stop_codon:yes gene_type:complete